MRQRQVDRIEACIALSASGNDHEALAALDRARHLMSRDGIDLTDLSERSRNTLHEAQLRLAMIPASTKAAAEFAAAQRRRQRARKW